MNEEASSSTDLTAAPGPPFLFSDATLEAITDLEKREHRYTLERLRVQRPEAIPEVVRLSLSGMSGRAIAGLLKLHQATVAEVLSQEREAVEALSLKLAGKAKLAAMMLIDRIIEEPGIVPANSIGFTASQLIDKAQLLSGGVTQRVESIRTTGDLHEDYNRLLAGLPCAEAVVVEPAGTGSTGEETLPIAGDAEAVDSQEAVGGDRSRDGSAGPGGGAGGLLRRGPGPVETPPES